MVNLYINLVGLRLPDIGSNIILEVSVRLFFMKLTFKSADFGVSLLLCFSAELCCMWDLNFLTRD